MLLLIFKNGSVKQSRDGLTEADETDVANGNLQVYRYSGMRFQQLGIIEGKPNWYAVTETIVQPTEDGRKHV